FIKVNCPLYLDNVILAPETANGISVIEGNFNDVVIGMGVSCLNRPFGENDYPYLVGGKWRYTGDDPAKVYDSFKSGDEAMISDKEYTLTVLSGTWQAVIKGSARQTEEIDGSAVNGTLLFGKDAKIKSEN
ncbi:MAG: hypothetical protein IIW21_08915, partial [Clostridia bacterium]|nr:hypothetical protein [Clostridia bacterium]